MGINARNTEERPETIGLKIHNFVALTKYPIQMTASLGTQHLPVSFKEIKFSVKSA